MRKRRRDIRIFLNRQFTLALSYQGFPRYIEQGLAGFEIALLAIHHPRKSPAGFYPGKYSRGKAV